MAGNDLFLDAADLKVDPKDEDDVPPEEFDAFNDDTFGMEAGEWEESNHEHLAQLTEEERTAMKNSDAFFEFGDDDGEGLEPLEDELESNGKGGELEKPEEALAEQMQAGMSLQEQPVPHPQQQQQAAPPAFPPMPTAFASVPTDDPAVLNAVPMPQQPQQPHFPPARPQFDDPAIMNVGAIPPGMPPMPPHMMAAPQAMPPQPQMAPPMMMGHMQPMMAPPPPHMQQQQQGPLPPHIIAQQQHMQRQRQMMQMQQHQQHQQRPPMPKTVQELEHEMRNHQRMMHMQQQHHHHQQQQQHQRQRFHHQQHQQYHGGQQGFHNYHDNRHPQQHHQHQRGHYNNNRSRADDKNRETFGDDLVDENNAQRERERRGGGNFSNGGLGGFQRQNSARSDLMPGQVHVRGILRHAREQREQLEQQRESTGNPQLDLELERRDRHQEDWKREYYNRQTDDPYAGLMTPKERQWVINIQLQQLKCENPFLDDYYCTVYHQKKALEEEGEEEEETEEGVQLKRTEEGPQLLLKEETGGDSLKGEYKPVQFTNSLGKLQAVTVKAPRKIIDVDVVNNDVAEITTAQKESRNYKSTLMEIERLYDFLIDVEDCEKKIAALPTNTQMRKQFEQEKVLAVQKLSASLSVENRIKRYLIVRKGKILLKRSFRLLDASTSQLFCSTLFQLFPLVLRKDREEHLVNAFWPDLRRHLRRASFDLLQHYLKQLNIGATQAAGSSSSKQSSYSTFKVALGNTLGASILALGIKRMGSEFEGLGAEDKKTAEALAKEVYKAIEDAGEIAAPLEAVKLEPVEGLYSMKSKEFEKLAKTAALQEEEEEAKKEEKS